MSMTDRERRMFAFEDRILELIENQLRNDDQTLTQSDLQGAVGALVMRIMGEEKKIVVDHEAYKRQLGTSGIALSEMNENAPSAFQLFIDRMVELGALRIA